MMHSIVSLVTLIVSWNISEIAAYSPLMASSNNIRPNSEQISRRVLLLESSAVAAALGTTALLTNPPSANAATTLTKFEDTNCKFSIDLPSDWTQSTQTLPDRRKIVLYIKPDSNQKTLIFLAYTPVRDDFTSLSSFGSVDEVAQATILPKGELAGQQGVESEMLSAIAKQQAYFFDYKQTVPTQPETHFRTIFSLATGATGGAGNVLVTITAQTPESEYNAMKPLFDDVIKSYA
ncbi:photosystem II oxygen evolving complex protein PsbP [Nitzschia inconspicua]|uniref:Photosystem II oxygen evolving complex protein PsbP n=1 Tax=Nitzschia inconspicua TaxID=303405 RepID=A0A9K3PRB4_9STRA|nr:photosystem II oxygen evolving complex protein PsbP [Nitzschia inconspicua]